MPVRNLLYIEDSVGVGGSIESLCRLLENLDRSKYNAYALVYHSNQQTYVTERCSLNGIITAHPMPSLRSRYLGQCVTRWASRFCSLNTRRAVSFLLFIADLLLVILPYSFKVFCVVKRRKWKIDLVHLNTGVCLPGIILSKFLRAQCIATQRGPEHVSPVTRFFSKYISLFIAITRKTQEELEALGVDSAIIKVIYPPVDLKKFNFLIDCSRQKTELALSQESFCVGIFGILAPWKGHRVFLEAAVEVLRSLEDCKFLVVGDTPDGSEQYKSELKCLADSLGIRDRVIFTGFRKDVAELVQLLDVVVHTSVTPEPFGKVIIEGMAMKKPLVATRGGGTGEIIDDGVNGFLLPPNDPKLLAQKIIELAMNKDLTRRVGEAAWNKVKSNFTVEQHVASVEQIYSQLLPTSRGFSKALRRGSGELF